MVNLSTYPNSISADFNVLRHFEFIKHLSPRDLDWLYKNMSIRTIQPKEFISFDHNRPYVYFLQKGVVKILSILSDDQEDEDYTYIKYLVKEGNIFGELAMTGGESVNDIAIAMEPCTLFWVHTNIFNELLWRHKGLNKELTKLLGERVRKVEKRLSSVVFKDAKTRIIEFIFDFVKEFGKHNSNKWVANNFLTHTEIAQLTATSRQTVATIMNKLRKDGIIDYNAKALSISYASAMAS